MNQTSFRSLRTLMAVLGASVFIQLVSSRVSADDAAKQPAPAAVVPATQPTIDLVQAAIDSKDYPAAIKLANKLLSAHGPAAAGLSRFQLIMLRGDAQAGMKSISTAIMTYKSAMKETKDVKEIALAKWTAELFHVAGANVYNPKMIAVGVPRRGPFDLMIPEQRKDGFGALLDDNLSALDPKLKIATVSQNLPTIMPVLQQVEDLDQLDVIANGNDDKTTALAGSLLDHSRNLLANALKGYWARLGDIETHASQTSTSQSNAYVNNVLVTQTTTRKNGLTQSNTAELNNIMSTAQKIHDAANVFVLLAKSDQGWNTILSDADRVAGKASDILGADYSDVTNDTTSANANGILGNTSGTPFGGTTATVQGSGITAQNVTQTPPPKRSNAPSNPNVKPKSN